MELKKNPPCTFPGYVSVFISQEEIIEIIKEKTGALFGNFKNMNFHDDGLRVGLRVDFNEIKE